MLNEKRNSIMNNIIYTGIGSIIYTFCQWLLTIIIIRICGYTDSGYYALAITVTNTFYSISLWGIRSFQVADINNKYDYSDYFYVRVLTNIIATILFFIFMLANRYSYSKSIIIVFYMLYKVIDSFYDFFDALCQKNMRMDIVSISMIIRSLISTVVFALLCLLYKSVLPAIISMIIISVAFLYFYNYRFCKKNFKINYRINLFKIKNLLLVCMPLMLSGFMTSFNLMIPKYIFEKMQGSELLGIYTTVTSPALIVQLAAQTILGPLLPVLSKYYNGKEYKNFRTIIIKFLLLLSIILLLVLIGIRLFGNWAIGLIYGRDLSKYSELLYLAAVSSFFTISLWLTNYLLLLINKIKTQLITSTISAFICLLISHHCVKYFSLNGISIAVIISQICLLFMIIYIIIKNFKKDNFVKT